MTRSRLISLPVLAAASLAFALATTGCSGDDTNPPAPATDAGPDATADSGATPDGSATTPDGSATTPTGTDGGSDAGSTTGTDAASEAATESD